MKNYFELNGIYTLHPGMKVQFLSSHKDNQRLLPYLERFQVSEFEPDYDGSPGKESPESSVFKIKTPDGKVIKRKDFFVTDLYGACWLSADEFKYFTKVPAPLPEQDLGLLPPLEDEDVSNELKPERYDIMVSQQDSNGYYVRALDKTEEECEAWSLDWLESYPKSDIVMIKRFKKFSLKVTKEVISVPFD